MPRQWDISIPFGNTTGDALGPLARKRRKQLRVVVVAGGGVDERLQQAAGRVARALGVARSMPRAERISPT